jgi:crossover junction endodeoxyribonuclease RuvC
MVKTKKKELISEVSISQTSIKRILGLDLSLTGTGWVLDDTLSLNMGLIDTDKMEGLARIDHILNKIAEVLNLSSDYKNHLPSEVLVVIEDFSFASKGSGLFQIAGLGYLIRWWLYKQGVKFILIPPTVLKKFVTGVGNADKNIILKEIYKRWGADINDDNIGDAYVLTKIGRAQQGWDKPENLVAFQKAVLIQLENKNA